MKIYKLILHTIFIIPLLFNPFDCCLADASTKHAQNVSANHKAKIEKVGFYKGQENYKFPLKAINITKENPYLITKIIDGDTIKFKSANKNEPIRLLGIDCDETSKIARTYKQAYLTKRTTQEVIESGIEAKEYLIQILKTEPRNYVNLQITGVDKYSRLLGVVYKNGENVNERLIKSGMCSIYEYKD